MSPGVIDAHIAERLCEKRPLPTGLNYEFEVLGMGRTETIRVLLVANSLDSSRKM